MLIFQKFNMIQRLGKFYSLLVVTDDRYGTNLVVVLTTSVYVHYWFAKISTTAQVQLKGIYPLSILIFYGVQANHLDSGML